MSYKALTQIILVVISGILIFFVIKPQYEKSTEVQESIEETRESIEVARELNSRLSTLRNQANSLSSRDRDELNTYIPQRVDALDVARDINTIATRNLLVVSGISAGEITVPEESVGDQATSQADQEIPGDEFAEVDESTRSPITVNKNYNPASQTFTLSAAGTYSQLKSALSDFERNAYPLRLKELTFSGSEGGGEDESGVGSSADLLNFEMVFETYALEAPVDSEETNSGNN